MFPADSPLAALSVTGGTLRGQAVLALAGAVRTGRGQGPGGCGWAPLIHTFSERALYRESCCREHLLLPLSSPLCPSRSFSLGEHRCPNQAASGLGCRGMRTPPVWRRDIAHEKPHTGVHREDGMAGMTTQREHNAQRIESSFYCPLPRGAKGGYKMKPKACLFKVCF